MIMSAARENPIVNQGEVLCPKESQLGIRSIVVEGIIPSRKPNPKTTCENFPLSLIELLRSGLAQYLRRFFIVGF
jgi:hypothetical protein